MGDIKETKLRFNTDNLVLVIVIIVVLTAGVLMFGTSTKPPVADTTQTMVQNTMDTVGELVIEDLIVGDGQEAAEGDTVSVHYTGTLMDGTKFDSSVDRGVPFEFELGAGSVIDGWDQGVAGMKVGGKRKLTIPSHLAYGDRGTPDGSIPGGASLIFEIELLEVSK